MLLKIKKHSMFCNAKQIKDPVRRIDYIKLLWVTDLLLKSHATCV